MLRLTQRSRRHDNINYTLQHDDDDRSSPIPPSHIHQLPSECLLQIFQFFQDLDHWPTSRTDRLHLMLVCREWHSVMDSEIMWERVVRHLFAKMQSYRRWRRRPAMQEIRTIEDEVQRQEDQPQPQLQDDIEGEGGGAAVVVLSGENHGANAQPRLFVNPMARDVLDDDIAHGDHVLVEREINDEALDFRRELPFDELPVSNGYKQFWQRLHGIYTHKKQVLLEREKQRFRETFFSRKLKRIVYFTSFAVIMICNALILCMSFAFVLEPFFTGDKPRHPDYGKDPRPSVVSLLFRYLPLPFAFLALMALLLIELGVAMGKKDHMDTFKWGTITVSLVLASCSVLATIVNFEILPSGPMRTLTNIYHLDRRNVINMTQMLPWPLALLPLELAIVLMLLLTVMQCTTAMNIDKALMNHKDESTFMTLLNSVLLVTVPFFAFHLQFPDKMPAVFVFALLVIIEFSFFLFGVSRLTHLYGRYTLLRMRYRRNEITRLDAVTLSPRYHRNNRILIFVYWFITIHSMLVMLFTSVSFIFGIENEPYLNFYQSSFEHGCLLYGSLLILRNYNYHKYL